MHEHPTPCEHCGKMHEPEHSESSNDAETLAKVSEEAFFELVKERVKEKLKLQNEAEISCAADIAVDAMKQLWREDLRGQRDESMWETLHLKACAIWKQPGSKPRERGNKE